MIVDASDQILGRLSSEVAKLLMKGEEVKIINAEKAIITGNPEKTLEKYFRLRARGDPHHGPYYPKQAFRILKRAIRGMLPYKKPKGREAFNRLRVYDSNPENEKGEKITKTSNEILCKFITLGEISKRLKGA